MSQDIVLLLKESGEQLQKLAAENKDLREKLARAERKEEAMKLAYAMPLAMRKGEDPLEYAEKLASSNEDLEVVRRVLEYSSDMPKLAEIGESFITDRPDVPEGRATDAMNAWLLGGSGNGFGQI